MKTFKNSALKINLFHKPFKLVIMKTLKTTILTLSFLLFASILVKANPAGKEKKTIDYVLNTYIACTTQGNMDGFTQLLDDTFQQSITYGGKTLNYNKAQIISYMKNTKNVIQNCTAVYSFVENNDNFSIAKVELKYPNFTKIDYVTMSNNGTDWNITKVFTTYN